MDACRQQHKAEVEQQEPDDMRAGKDFFSSFHLGVSPVLWYNNLKAAACAAVRVRPHTPLC